jgi:hypothetical protein
MPDLEFLDLISSYRARLLAKINSELILSFTEERAIFIPFVKKSKPGLGIFPNKVRVKAESRSRIRPNPIQILKLLLLLLLTGQLLREIKSQDTSGK